MKFLVKDKEQQIPEGMKEVDIDVVQIGFTGTMGLYLLSMTKVGGVSLFASKAIAQLIAIGSLPLTTICGGILLTVSTSLIISQLVDDCCGGKIKNNQQQTETEKEISILLNKMKQQAMAIQNNKKEIE